MQAHEPKDFAASFVRLAEDAGQSLQKARGEIGNRIGDQKLRGEREKYLDRLRLQATITWRNAELQKAYETALAKRKGTPSQESSAAETAR